jgi:Holliday junction DNA helicase RuvA
MIAALSGRLAELEVGEQVASAVVEVGGVGYEVVIGSHLASRLAALGEPVHLAIHTYVREGSITLYGFATPKERRMFRVLLGAHGVGPALALAVLEVHSPDALARAVAAGDVAALVAVPGVGRKTAQRLIVELAGRLDAVATGDQAQMTPPSPAEEVASALAGLGYDQDEIRSALDGLDEVHDVEEALRQALRSLAPRP